MRLFAALAVLTLGSSVALAGEAALKPLPLPSVDGKALAISPGQKVFRVPLRFAKVEAFYREQFKGQEKVTLKAASEGGRRTLSIVSRRGDDTWAKAVVREGEVETAIEVTPVTRIEETKVEGKAMPLVIVIPRSSEVEKTASSIEHLQRAR
ncbi:MAG TPA: hypothetical protein VGK67_36665 [Myxococcales bacterium]|jgi:hypothetical protein